MPADAASLVSDAEDTFRAVGGGRVTRGELDEAVTKLERAAEAADADPDVPDDAAHDVHIMAQAAQETVDAARPDPRKCREVAEIGEFGLRWALQDPDECPGYGGEVDTERHGLRFGE